MSLKQMHLVGHVETRIADLQQDLGRFQFSDEEHVQKSLGRIGRELQRLELHRSMVQRLNCPQALMPEYMRAKGLAP